MGNFEGHPGTSKLASVLAKRMKKENEAPLVLDFGEIQGNGSLITNTFPVPIPKGDYSVCRHIGGFTFQIDGGEHSGHSDGNGMHSHIVAPPPIKSGNRVLVAWVQNEAVVVDIIVKS